MFQGNLYRILIAAALWFGGHSTLLAASPAAAEPSIDPFPLPLSAYESAEGDTLWTVLKRRAAREPFNVLASVLFLCAIVHTFLASRFMHLSHKWRDEHAAKLKANEAEGRTATGRERVSFKAEIMHFLGEVEAVFGIWTVPLVILLALNKGWPTAENYITNGVNFTEPLFVVVIMIISATRPVLTLAEQCMGAVARLIGSGPGAWWIAILTVGPVLGSFITEPAAMTISALLLARQFYDLKPSLRLRYATLGLLFVNVSIGGTLTHFAAPPVLMVAGTWGWDLPFMLGTFGWKAVLAIVISNSLYYFFFRKEFAALRPQPDADERPVQWNDRTAKVPVWITVVHLGFLAWTIFAAHHPEFFIGAFLFFLAFVTATEHEQNPLALKPAILVGFFLAGLVIHGGFQAWWIEPVLGGFGETSLLLGAAGLTAFNDNAAITYLASLVPSFTEELKYAVVAGAVAGGGLTVIANAPNPAGQSILSDYFPDGISPLHLLLGALIPTVVVIGCFLLL
jgi:Na+/H+ antiporter NhaD/arsenite permease-like protein